MATTPENLKHPYKKQGPSISIIEWNYTSQIKVNTKSQIMKFSEKGDFAPLIGSINMKYPLLDASFLNIIQKPQFSFAKLEFTPVIRDSVQIDQLTNELNGKELTLSTTAAQALGKSQILTERIQPFGDTPMNRLGATQESVQIRKGIEPVQEAGIWKLKEPITENTTLDKPSVAVAYIDDIYSIELSSAKIFITKQKDGQPFITISSNHSNENRREASMVGFTLHEDHPIIIGRLDSNRQSSISVKDFIINNHQPGLEEVRTPLTQGTAVILHNSQSTVGGVFMFNDGKLYIEHMPPKDIGEQTTIKLKSPPSPALVAA